MGQPKLWVLIKKKRGKVNRHNLKFWGERGSIKGRKTGGGTREDGVVRGTENTEFSEVTNRDS